MTANEHDYYALLAVPRAASAREIRVAFYRLARRYHPDTHPTDPVAAERFKHITAAYAVLGDPERRRRYDRASAAPPSPAPGVAPTRGRGRSARVVHSPGSWQPHALHVLLLLPLLLLLLPSDPWSALRPLGLDQDRAPAIARPEAIGTPSPAGTARPPAWFALSPATTPPPTATTPPTATPLRPTATPTPVPPPTPTRPPSSIFVPEPTEVPPTEPAEEPAPAPTEPDMPAPTAAVLPAATASAAPTPPMPAGPTRPEAPTVAATVPALPLATVGVPALNLRTGPGVQFPALATIPRGAVVALTGGRAVSGDGYFWVEVIAPGGARGWLLGEPVGVR